MTNCPTQVSFSGPMQDVPPVTMYRDIIFVNGELWQYWREAFSRRSVLEMFDFVKCDMR